MQVRIALIALASVLSLSAYAGPYMTPLAKFDRPVDQSRTVGPAASAARAGVDAAGWLYVGGQEGYVFIGTGQNLSRSEFLQRQADPAAAGTRDGWIAVGGQEGARFVPQVTSLPRAQVQHDALHARHMPSAVDGWVVTGGEAGAVYTGAAAPRTVLPAHAPTGHRIDTMSMPDGTPCTMAG